MHNNGLQTRILASVALGLLFLPSCIKYHETIPTEFPQGQEKKDNRIITANYVRSVRIYDQFVTRAIFDALWLSDEVRVAYAHLYCSRRGKSVDDTEAFITRQREENNHWTSFYVLADVRDRQGTSLSDKNAPWTFYLKVGDFKAEALSVKEIDLEQEYQAFFASQFNSFKTAYLVKFPVCQALKANGNQLSEAVELSIESASKTAQLTWQPLNSHSARTQKEKQKVLRDEDFYWG